MAKNFENFEAMLGECEPECSTANSATLHKQYAQSINLKTWWALSSTTWQANVQATDFHSNTFQAIRLINQLEDLKEDVGVGGSWLDFMNYLVNSLSTSNVKLVLEQPQKVVGGTPFAKLIAQVSKGMPRISVSLERLPESTAKDTVAHIAMELYRGYKKKREDLAKEQGKSVQLTTMLAAEKHKNEELEDKFDSSCKRKLHRSIEPDSRSPASSAFYGSLDVKTDSNKEIFVEKVPSQKISTVAPRVKHGALPPAHRGHKTKGAILSVVDVDDDD